MCTFRFGAGGSAAGFRHAASKTSSCTVQPGKHPQKLCLIIPTSVQKQCLKVRNPILYIFREHIWPWSLKIVFTIWIVSCWMSVLSGRFQMWTHAAWTNPCPSSRPSCCYCCQVFTAYITLKTDLDISTVQDWNLYLVHFEICQRHQWKKKIFCAPSINKQQDNHRFHMHLASSSSLTAFIIIT